MRWGGGGWGKRGGWVRKSSGGCGDTNGADITGLGRGGMISGW